MNKKYKSEDDLDLSKETIKQIEEAKKKLKLK